MERPNDINADEEKLLRDALKGKTLATYFFLLGRSRPYSAREIQRRIGLSSPSLALYHLRRLEEIGLVKEESDGFSITKIVRLGVLRFFIGSGRLLLPRYIFYSFFSTGFLISTLALFDWTLTPTFLLLTIFLSFATVVFWFETIHVWRSRPMV
jgi:DNA-binding transcriptional ArsR family regulator